MATTAKKVKHTWTAYAVLKPSQPSFNRHGEPVEWRIDRNELGDFRCSCPSFIFSREKPKTCKHVARILKNTAAEATAVPVQVKPEESPYFAHAEAIFDEMCKTASAKVRFNVKSHIGLDAGKSMVSTLMQRLELFKPPPKKVSTAEVHDGVRIITFDD